MDNFFEGYYFKHQKENHTLCLIVGRSDTEKFIQVITEKESVKLPFTKGNHFSAKGIVLSIHTPELTLTGRIRYKELSPIRYDIMGPFCLFAMECRHGIVSMKHELEGNVVLNGETIDFTGGKGYIEMDSGRSFPTAYTWVQANDFEQDCSIMAAVADIPVGDFHFKGCICVIQYYGREYRLATYLGVRIISCTREKIILKQGRYRLVIRINSANAQKLSAPKNGKMTRTILEAASCPAEFSFFKGDQQIFHLYSEHAGFEYEKED